MRIGKSYFTYVPSLSPAFQSSNLISVSATLGDGYSSQKLTLMERHRSLLRKGKADRHNVCKQGGPSGISGRFSLAELDLW
jgi:hypothetical protein